jgi:Ca2+/Na+ antiporter
LIGLLTLAAISIAYGIRRREFAFVAYGAVYPYVGISLKLVQWLSVTTTMAYGVVSGSAMVIVIVYVARRFGREA